MAWRANLSRSVKELRFLFCQSSPASAAARDFVRKNYGEIKSLNPSLPVLVRECFGVHPQLWARYAGIQPHQSPRRRHPCQQLTPLKPQSAASILAGCRLRYPEHDPPGQPPPRRCSRSRQQGARHRHRLRRCTCCLH